MSNFEWILLGLLLSTVVYFWVRGRRPCKKLTLRDGTTVKQGSKCPNCPARDTIWITDYTPSRMGGKPRCSQYCTVCGHRTVSELAGGKTGI